jgi:hypothetical protein
MDTKCTLHTAVTTQAALLAPRGDRGWCLTGWRQGAGPAELLAAFDSVRATHEAMDPDAFNDDGTYKGGINQVPHVPCRGALPMCRRDVQVCAAGASGTCEGTP